MKNNPKKDPFADLGGADVVSATQDPFADLGGADVKKKGETLPKGSTQPTAPSAQSGGDIDNTAKTQRLQELDSKLKNLVNKGITDGWTAAQTRMYAAPIQREIESVLGSDIYDNKEQPQLSKKIDISQPSSTIVKTEQDAKKKFDKESAAPQMKAANFNAYSGNRTKDIPQNIDRTDSKAITPLVTLDYLDYRAEVHPEDGLAEREKYNDLKGKKDLNATDEEFLRDIESKAISLKFEGEKQKRWFLENEIKDLDAIPQEQLTQEQLDKRNSLFAQYGKLTENMKSISEMNQMNPNEYSQINKREKETDAKKVSRFENLQDGNGKFKEAVGAMVGAIGSGVVSIAQVPKVMGDMLGDTDYDWADELYDSVKNVKDDREAAYGAPLPMGKKMSDLPITARLAVVGGSAIGSVGLFAAGGSLGGTSKLGQSASTFGTAFLTSEANYYDEAKAAGMSDQESGVSAGYLAAATAAIETIIPDVKYFEPSAFRKSVVKELFSGKPYKEAIKSAINALPESTLSYIKPAIKEGGEEVLGQVGEDVSKESINAIGEKEYFKETFEKENYVDAIIGGFLSGGGLSAFSRPKTPLQEEVLMEGAENADTIISTLKEKSTNDMSGAVDALKSAQQALDALKSHSGWNNIDKTEQAHALALTQQIVAIEEEQKKIGSVRLEDKAKDEQIKKIEEELNSLFNEKKEAKNTEEADGGIDLREGDKKDEAQEVAEVKNEESPTVVEDSNLTNTLTNQEINPSSDANLQQPEGESKSILEFSDQINVKTTDGKAAMKMVAKGDEAGLAKMVTDAVAKDEAKARGIYGDGIVDAIKTENVSLTNKRNKVESVDNSGVEGSENGLSKDENQDKEKIGKDKEQPKAETKNDGGNSVGGEVVYHGTKNNFEEFDQFFLGENTKANSAKEGFFFATNKDVATSYASEANRIHEELQEDANKAAKELEDITKMTPEGYTSAKNAKYRMDFGKTPKEITDNNEKIKNIFERINKFGEYDMEFQHEPIWNKNEIAKNASLKSVRLEMKNPLIHDFKGENYRDESYTDIIKKAKKEGHDSVIFKNTFDGNNPYSRDMLTDIHVVFDKSQIKAVEQSLKEQPIEASATHVGEQINELIRFKDKFNSTANKKWRMKEGRSKANELQAMADKHGISVVNVAGGRIKLVDKKTGKKVHRRGDAIIKTSEETKEYEAKKKKAIDWALTQGGLRNAILAMLSSGTRVNAKDSELGKESTELKKNKLVDKNNKGASIDIIAKEDLADAGYLGNEDEHEIIGEIQDVLAAYDGNKASMIEDIIASFDKSENDLKEYYEWQVENEAQNEPSDFEEFAETLPSDVLEQMAKEYDEFMSSISKTEQNQINEEYEKGINNQGESGKTNVDEASQKTESEWRKIKSEIEERLIKAKAARKKKFDSISGKPQLFNIQAKDEILDVDNVTPEEFANRQIKSFDEAVSLIEKELSEHEKNKDKFIRDSIIKDNTQVDMFSPSTSDKIIAKLDSLKSKPGQLNESILGIPIAIWDGAIEAAKLAVKATNSLNKGINAAIKYLKDSDWYKDATKEQQDKAIDDLVDKISEFDEDDAINNEEELSKVEGERRQTSRSKRIEEQQDFKDKLEDYTRTYTSVNTKAIIPLAQKYFDGIKQRIANGEKIETVFGELYEYLEGLIAEDSKSVKGEVNNNPLNKSAFAIFVAQAALSYSIQIGNSKEATDWNNFLGAKGKHGGTIAALQNAGVSLDPLLNRLQSEDAGRKDFLAQVINGTMTVGEAIKELAEVSKLTKEELGTILDIKTPKRATHPTTQRQKFKKEREDIMAKVRAKMQLSSFGPMNAIPEILDLANSYLKEGVYTMNKVKEKVWNDFKELFPDGQEDLNKVLDDNAKKFEAGLKANKENNAASKLAKALEGNTSDPNNQKKKALKIIADTILANDPDYVTARNNKERVSAKDRLKAILADKDAVSKIIEKALSIATAKVQSDKNLSDSQKQAVINQMEDMVAEITELPVNKTQQRAVAGALSDEDLQAEVKRIAEQHYTDTSGEIKSYAQKLVEELDIDPAYAEALQKKIEEKIEAEVQKKLDAQKEKTEKLLEAIGSKDKNMKSVVAKAIAKGMVSDSQFEEELLKALGYRGLSLKDIATIKNLMARMEDLDAGEEIYEELSKQLNDILTEADETTGALLGRWLTEQFYINALSNFVTTALQNSLIGAFISSIQQGASAAIYNPKRFARAMKYAKEMKANNARPGWQTIAAKWHDVTIDFGETTQHDKQPTKAHSAVVRVTMKSYSDMLDDLKNAKHGRKLYYAMQMAFKTASHIMGAGKRKHKFPAYAQISTAIMSSQDLLQGALMEDINTYIEAERHLDILNKERKKNGRKPIPKGTKRWNDRMRILTSTNPEKIAQFNKEVDEEARVRIANGEELPKGWKRRRMRTKMQSSLPKSVLDEAIYQGKKALFLHKPESKPGALIYKLVSDALIINDKDGGIALVKTLSTMITGFLRLSIVASELGYRTIPIIPIITKLSSGEKQRFIDGKVVGVPLTEEDIKRRIVSNLATTAAFALLLSSMFDWEEDEDEQGNKIKVMKLDPNFGIKFYGSGDDEKQRNIMKSEGAEPNSVTIGGKNIPLTLLGFGIGVIGKVLGEVSNDIRFREKPTDEVMSFDDILGVTTAQIIGAEYSPVKKSLKEVYSYGGSHLEAIEVLALDGIETALSPSLLEAIKKEYDAIKGIQKQKRDGVSDQIFGDIVFVDYFIDKNGGKLYDHFGQPIYSEPSTPILKALLPETIWANGVSHVKNSPYYSLTKGEWYPKPYNSWTAKDWNWEENGKPRTYSDEQKEDISREMDMETANLINSEYKTLEAMKMEDRLIRLKEIRSNAIDNVREKYSKSPSLPDNHPSRTMEYNRPR